MIDLSGYPQYSLLKISYYEKKENNNEEIKD